MAITPNRLDVLESLRRFTERPFLR